MDTVRSWMTSPAIIARDTMTLPEARQLMNERQIRRLPVVDATGRLVGIVSRGDINSISASHVTDVRDYNLHYRVHDLPLSEIMTRDVVTVTPETDLQEVAQLLLKHKIGGIPVISHGRVVGMITESDLFRMIITTEQAAQVPAIHRGAPFLEHVPVGSRLRVCF